MLSVFIIGNGRMAQHLAQALAETDVQIEGVYARDEVKGKLFAEQIMAPFYSKIEEVPPHCDVYFLAVSDQAIPTLSALLNVQGLVVHCAGMVSINAIHKQVHRGVFWPIQSFSKHTSVSFKEIPICIEANSEENVRILEAIADRISKSVHILEEKQRQKLHVAAVVVNNFSNHLFVLAENFLQENELSFNLMKPLIKETAAKIEYLSPRLAQTGPANRNDLNTLLLHQDLLSEYSNLLEVYTCLSESIIKNKSV